MKKIMVLLGLLAVAGVAVAGYAPVSKHIYLGEVLEFAGDDSSTDSTVSKRVEGFTKVVMTVDITQSSATAFTARCSGSIDQGTTYGRIMSRSISGGVGTLSEYYDTFAISTSKTISLNYDVWGYTHFKCEYDLVGGTSLDIAAVQWLDTVGK